MPQDEVGLDLSPILECVCVSWGGGGYPQTLNSKSKVPATPDSRATKQKASLTGFSESNC